MPLYKNGRDRKMGLILSLVFAAYSGGAAIFLATSWAVVIGSAAMAYVGGLLLCAGVARIIDGR